MKVDLKKELDSYRARRGEFRVLDVLPAQYLMVDGHGDPNTAQEYADALAALYPVAYTLKFASKVRLDRDYVVMPLEALWWSSDMNAFTTARDKSMWEWTAMILLPSWITAEMYDDSVAEVGRKNPPAGLEKLRLEMLTEGLCVQTLHVGSYDDEGPLLVVMHREVIPQAGLKMTGRHHEIYLSDPRRVLPSTFANDPAAAGDASRELTSRRPSRAGEGRSGSVRCWHPPRCERSALTSATPRSRLGSRRWRSSAATGQPAASEIPGRRGRSR